MGNYTLNLFISQPTYDPTRPFATLDGQWMGHPSAYDDFFDINDRNILIKKEKTVYKKRLGLRAIKQRAMQAM